MEPSLVASISTVIERGKCQILLAVDSQIVSGRPRTRPTGQPNRAEPDSWPAFLAWLLRQGWREYLNAVVLVLVIAGAFELFGSRVLTSIMSFIH